MLGPQVCYAAKALAHVVARGEGAMAVKAIARATGIPNAYLAKIVHHLARKGLVSTRRGVGGGVTDGRLRPLARVTLHDLCVAFDDPIVDHRCLIGEAECSDERACPAHAFWSPQRHRMTEFLARTTLGEIARFEARLPRARKERR